jgi:glycosyltransferase involved in cell wall biosynthesis
MVSSERSIPILSIAIPTYKRAQRVKLSVEHILRSPIQDVEIVVNDNASGDGTVEGLRLIADPRLRVFSNSKNLGFKGNIFKLVERCRGDFILFISDEDLLETSCLVHLIDLVTRLPDLAVIYGGIRKSNGSIYQQFSGERQYSPGSESIAKLAFTHSYMSGLTLNRRSIHLEPLRQYLSYSEFIYTHELIAALCMLKGPALTTEKILINRGEEVNDHSDRINNQPYWFIVPRIRQWLFHLDFVLSFRNEISWRSMTQLRYRLANVAAQCALRSFREQGFHQVVEGVRTLIHPQDLKRVGLFDTFLFIVAAAHFSLQNLKSTIARIKVVQRLRGRS